MTTQSMPLSQYERHLCQLGVDFSDAEDLAGLPFIEDVFDPEAIVPPRFVSASDRPLGDNGHPCSLGDLQLYVLSVRRNIADRISARRECIVLAELHTTEAAEMLERAQDHTPAARVKNEHHRRRLYAMAVRSKEMARRCMEKARGYEMECMAWLNKLDGE
uniref:Uncharacterized protein n=1 Tax=viral metagenome TaxID=1070528 RepID=A0A6M3IM03_9ZZZZ